MPGDFQGFESLLSSRLFAQTAQSLELADSEQSRKNLNNKTIGHTVLYGISYYIPVLGYSSHTPTEFWN